MLYIIQRLILIKLILFTFGCATSSVRVTSWPDKAEVFLAYEGEQPNKIGETPLTLNSNQLSESRGRYATLYIKKDGYQTEALIVPAHALGLGVDISSRLVEYKLPAQCQDQNLASERLARGIAEAQTLIKSNNLDGAQNRIQILLNEFPNVSVLHALLGNVLYLNRNLERALQSYQKAQSIDPNNTDTQGMIAKIRSIIQIRVPSGQQGGF